MTTEPETLGPADVADVPIGNSSLDKAFRYLASKGEPATVAEIAERAYRHQGEPGDVHLEALRQNLATDPRFVVGHTDAALVYLAEDNPNGQPAAKPAAETPADAEIPGETTVEEPAAEPARTIGEAVLNAAAEAGERERHAQAIAEQEHEDAEKIRAHMGRIREAQARLVELEAEHERCKRIASAAKNNVDEQRETLRALIETDPLSDEHEARQTTIDEAIARGPEGEPLFGDEVKPADAKAWGLDALSTRIADGGWLHVEQLGVELDDLAAAAISATASTGKPYQVRPLKVEPFDSEAEGETKLYALTAVQHHGKVPVAVLVELHPLGAWPWPDAQPVEIPSADRPEPLAKLGRWAGIPCRVKRKRFALGSDADALLVALPSAEGQRLEAALHAPAADEDDGEG